MQVTPGQGRGRECDAEAVNVGLIKKWIRRCDAAHQHSCVREFDMHLLPTAELNFIDVEDLCIVRPKTEVRYVALSYVWGTLPVLRALKSNIVDLGRPRAFSSAQYRLPRTIRDAVTLCSLLGIRYLWVDSVCIVQDDPVSQEAQLRAMGTVYGKAYFTIAALQSEHADAGIYRVGPTEAACKPQDVVRLPSRSLIAASNRPAMGLGVLSIPDIKWNTRGWTLQEHVFSRRILAMGRLVTWVCFGDQWTEDVEFATELEGSPISTDTANDDKLGIVTWPSINAYSKLALEYARRDLTYSSDTINAFSGILTPMNGWFPGGLLYGVAEFTFDAGLLWNPRGEGAHLRCDPGTSPLAGGSVMFPTWSWISWTGKLQFNLWGEGEDYIFPKRPFLVKTLVAWQKRLVSTGAWVDVDNTYHVVRAHFRSDKSPPPPIPDGWTKHFDSASGEVYYRHTSHNHIVPQPRFSYPIPPFVRPRDMDRKAYHPYLRFRGTRARIKLAIDPFDRSELSATLQERGRTTEADMTTSDGNWAGRLRLNLQKGDRVPLPDETIEVIAISEAALCLRKAAHAPDIFREISERKELDGIEVYEMVNVLWIGWLDTGMAYRKALGRVWKPAWTRAAVEEAELMLT
ncbi:heterokaryon incompatibility protein [Halenospora varia]|nr:heterokaryon incompatibility protein [Halenospora varia]